MHWHATVNTVACFYFFSKEERESMFMAINKKPEIFEYLAEKMECSEKQLHY